MEKLDPVPVRALAFVQLQLSQVLYKQGEIYFRWYRCISIRMRLCFCRYVCLSVCLSVEV